eukprot:364795-Chlamydomonas_euryale.AAC.1
MPSPLSSALETLPPPTSTPAPPPPPQMSSASLPDASRPSSAATRDCTAASSAPKRSTPPAAATPASAPSCAPAPAPTLLWNHAGRLPVLASVPALASGASSASRSARSALASSLALSANKSARLATSTPPLPPPPPPLPMAAVAPMPRASADAFGDSPPANDTSRTFPSPAAEPFPPSDALSRLGSDARSSCAQNHRKDVDHPSMGTNVHTVLIGGDQLRRGGGGAGALPRAARCGTALPPAAR